MSDLTSTTTPVVQPYRIGTTYKTRPTDGRSQIIAATHGPIRSRHLTYNYNPRLSRDANHEAAALSLAVKVTGTPTPEVSEHSSNDSGTHRDYAVTIHIPS